MGAQNKAHMHAVLYMQGNRYYATLCLQCGAGREAQQHHQHTRAALAGTHRAQSTVTEHMHYWHYHGDRSLHLN